MIRILKCMSNIRGGVLCIQRYAEPPKRTYPTDRAPPPDGNDSPPAERPRGDPKQGLYSGGPLHLRVDQMPPRGEPEGVTSDDADNVPKDSSLEDEETEEILEGLFTGEPLRLRVDQIRRDAEEIRMMNSQIEHGKKEQNTEETSLVELSVTAKKWRERRSERYFPKLKKPPRASTLNELKVETVIRSYWSRGHIAALIDPLYIVRKPMFRPEFPSRRVLKQHRVPVDKETLYHLLPDDATTLGGGYNRIKLDKLMKRLNTAYCDKIGAEFCYVHNPEARNWIKNMMETTELRFMNREQQRYCMSKLIKIEAFSEFLKDKIPKKDLRYISLGSETSVLGVHLLIERAMKKHNARTFVIGMRRLGRLNVMANVLKVPPETIFSLLQSEISQTKESLCLGIHSVVPSSFLKDVKKRITLISSCSTPENFYPLGLGFVKGLQLREDDTLGEKVWPIVIHMAKGLNSQGIVYETLKLNQLPDYETFGTIHVIFNNQMEKTLPRGTHMTTEYCTDPLRTLNIPIFHVNGDDVKAVHYVMRMAADFRAQFQRDVAVDIVSYSRFMTERVAVKFELIQVQQAISQTEPIVQQFAQELIKEGFISQSDITNWRKECTRNYSEAWQKVFKEKIKMDKNVWNSQLYLDKILNYEKKYDTVDADTGVEKEKLYKISQSLCLPPDKINLCPRHTGFLKKRRYLVENNKLDWVICEALAFGSLLLEGKNVRLSGMDVNRRIHIVQEDVENGKTFNLLSNIQPDQANYFLCKSTTSQYATAAFEYGFSTATLRTMVIWEAPEGDKTSKAQVVIDHYIAGGYLKYNYHSNIVFLIPHYHKCESASKVCNGRPERFLQLVNDCETETESCMKTQMKKTNMVLANVSTPANFFHILRRQMYLPCKRPLIIFTPNLLVSHPESKAQFADLTPGTRFKPYIPDESITDIYKVKKIILCTGRIYYDLKAERKNRGLEGLIAICRIEQICPLPYKIINADLLRFWSVKMAWVQEEPINQGWWTYLEQRLGNLPSVRDLQCVARPPRADGGSRSIPSCYDEHFLIFEQAMKVL